MNERSYTHMDRTGWGQGPWSDEPDKCQWIDEATGYDSLIVRNRMGALCGYVGVPPGHPAHGLDYQTLVVVDEDGQQDYPDVHGGLTYAGGCQESEPEDRGICHVPAPGRPADVWWLGFDCAHGFDVVPAMDARERASGMPTVCLPGETYKTVGYAARECSRLAAQLVDATVGEARD